ncbi:MAG: hypothetical protein RR740_25520, partial [Pseudomonas sp.]
MGASLLAKAALQTKSVSAFATYRHNTAGFSTSIHFPFPRNPPQVLCLPGFALPEKSWSANCLWLSSTAVGGKRPACRGKSVDKYLYVAMTGASQNALAQR